MQNISGKFVVLLHTTADGEHYDLMLEEADSLKTWQFREFPSAGQVAELIFPHRKAYLNYEGPISNNRGNVTKVDTGTFKANISETKWIINFQGQRLGGKYSIKLIDDQWVFKQTQS